MQNTFNGKLSAKITQNGLLNAKTLEKQMLLICFIVMFYLGCFYSV